MDPLTILAAAKGSYEAIKAGIKLGKEVQGMFKDVSSLMDSVAHLTRIAADPPKPKLFSGESAEKLAMDAYMAKSEAEKMYREVQNAFVAENGLGAWEWVLKETARIKKEQKAAALKAQAEREKSAQNLLVWAGAIGAILLTAAVGIIVVVIATH
ncbi:peptidase [Caudoviricetes sp.]|nr:peptidase [Caudoviricetes sp.]